MPNHVRSLIVLWFLTACVLTPTPAPSATPPVTDTPTASNAQPTATPDPAANLLRLWLPPHFAPDAENEGGEVLLQQIAAFEEAHGLEVQVRLKAERGSGSLLEALLNAYNVAPSALPDVVALSHDDLVAAASAGAVIPLESWLPPDVRQDAYPFAQALGQVDGRWMGVPFAADARILVYNTDVYTTAPARWRDIITGTLIFPAGEDTGLTVLSEYLALGGPLENQAGEPALDAQRLASALRQFQNAQQADVLPLSTLNYTDPARTWQIFRERRATLALTTAQWYLREANRVERSAAALPPTQSEMPFTLAEGWSWVVVNTNRDPARAADLIAWLAAPEQMGAWTQAARVLPTRTAVLAAWGDDPFAPLAAEVLTRAQPQPARDVLDTLGPLLRQAVENVLSGRASPEAAANTVAESFNNP